MNVTNVTNVEMLCVWLGAILNHLYLMYTVQKKGVT